MAFVTQVLGVFFTEGTLEGTVLGSIEVRAATQNTTLATVKIEMANKALAMGGDAVISYSYGQRADKGANLFKWDSERINATGIVIRLTQAVSLGQN